MPSEAPYGHGCPPEPFAGKASKYRIYGPESAKAGGWAARPGDAIPQPGHRGQAAAKKTSLPKAAENSEDRKGPAPCRKNKGLAVARKAHPPKVAKRKAANQPPLEKSEEQFGELLARIPRPHKGFANQKRIHITLTHCRHILTTQNAAFRHQQAIRRYVIQQTKRGL